MLLGFVTDISSVILWCLSVYRSPYRSLATGDCRREKVVLWFVNDISFVSLFTGLFLDFFLGLFIGLFLREMPDKKKQFYGS